MTSLPHTLKSAKAFYVFLEVGTREREFLEKHVRYRYTQASIPKRRGGTRTRFPDYGPGDELSKRPGKIIARPTKHGVKLTEASAMLPGGISGGPIVNHPWQVIAIAHRGGNQEQKQLAVEVSELLKLATE
jgi:RNA-directed DNA polymerase